MGTKNIKKNNQNNQNKNNNKNKIASSKKEKFESSSTSFEDVIDMISVSPSASNPDAVTMQDKFSDYLILFMKYAFLVGVLTLNFLGLSVALNCNADQELSQRIFSAIFAFFFGFVYLIINYYTYKVLGQGKICKMNRDKLFPFKV
jgi:hypothetical protein